MAKARTGQGELRARILEVACLHLLPGKLRMVGQLFILAAALVSLPACVTDYAIATPDPYYPADSSLGPEAIHAWHLVDLRPYQPVLYIRRNDAQSFVQPFQGTLPPGISPLRGQPATWVNSEEDFEAFLRATFQNMGYFKSVADYDEIAAGSVSQNAYLIADYLVDWQGGYDFSFHIRMIDPSTEEVFLHVSHNHYRSWPRLDQPLFFPVFNVVIDWQNACIEAEPPT